MLPKPCAVVGAGAIGKSMAGPTLQALGGEVVFLDVQPAVIADINRRGGYDIWEDEARFAPVRGVRALPVDGQEGRKVLGEAPLVVTAVGPKALRALAPALLEAFSGGGPRALLLFENDPQAKETLRALWGGLPAGLDVRKASIERMSRVVERRPGAFDVLAEPFIPAIVEREAARVSPALATPGALELVDGADKYYLRKLYTNNLGHAALGYLGTALGYQTSCEAVADLRVADLIRRAFAETVPMLVRRYGFAEAALKAHVDDLLNRRYANRALADPLERLARDPLRKLGREERLVGAALACLEADIEPGAVCEIIAWALRYLRAADPLQTLAAAGGLPLNHPIIRLTANRMEENP